MDTLIITSLIAAFLAGVAALFAPCCITVLLPSYIGSVFRERRTVLVMTAVFALGLLTIFLPLGLGVAGFGQLVRKYHVFIFGAGSIFLFSLGVATLLGKRFSLPVHVNTNTKIRGAGSVYVLGLLSGVATLCCAPVLAGVLALSVLPGSLFWGTLYAVLYVLGMVVPLIIIAAAMDMSKATKKFWAFRRNVTYTLGTKEITLRIADVISGVTFVLMSVVILALTLTNRLTSHSAFQTGVNVTVAKVTDAATKLLGSVPLPVFLGLVFLLLAAIVIAIRMVQRRSNQPAKPEGRWDK